jgi:hypothetical protein
MRVGSLRRYGSPDISAHLVHFVFRPGSHTDSVPEEIQQLPANARLETILREARILAFPVFGGYDPVVSFTECTPAGVSTLVVQGRYLPYGIGFSKDFIFAHGGGPAFYVRGDQYHLVESLPPPLRAMATRFWPGVIRDSIFETVPRFQTTESQWLIEREWRIMGAGEPPGLKFHPTDVSFLVLPDAQPHLPYQQVIIDSSGSISSGHEFLMA